MNISFWKRVSAKLVFTGTEQNMTRLEDEEVVLSAKFKFYPFKKDFIYF